MCLNVPFYAAFGPLYLCTRNKKQKVWNIKKQFKKNAGGIISHPFGSVIRSLMVAIYELGVKEVMVIAHSDCGACHMSSAQMIEHMKARGIKQETIDMIRFCGVDFDSWLYGFGDTEKSVRETVKAILDHPLIPEDVHVSGFIIDSITGALTPVVA